MAKIGSGALAAFVRQGAKETAQVLPAFPDSMRVVEEPGALGNPTQVEIFQAKQGLDSVQPSEREQEADLDMER